MASFNFVEPYLRSVFGFLGVTDATSSRIHAHLSADLACRPQKQ
jgi:FMN-dependent NADH-azoreductase